MDTKEVYKMTAIDEELIDYFINKLQDGWLSKNEDEPHFICKIREIEKEVKEQAVVINFLKKELQKKTSYRQVMKRQYRELKQKYDALEDQMTKLRRCETCKHCKPVVTVNETIGNDCEHFCNGCNNNPIIPFCHWELGKNIL